MQNLRNTSAPATAAEFKRDVTRGFRSANPGASILFTSRVRRFPGRADQPAGTVSFAVEFLASVDGVVEEFIATSYRSGAKSREGRIGSGHVEASRKGLRAVWA